MILEYPGIKLIISLTIKIYFYFGLILFERTNESKYLVSIFAKLVINL